MPDLKGYFATQQEQYLKLLDELVRIESPSTEKAAVDRLGAWLASYLASMPGSLTHYPQTDTGDFHLLRVAGKSADFRFLILCHMDTVWPLGTLSERLPRIEDGQFFAPGAADMKGGIVVALAALAGLHSMGLQPAGEVLLLLTSDEEIGSPTSRALIEAEGRKSSYCF